MRYRLLCIGRAAADPLLDAAEDYRTRLSRFVATEIVRLREGTPTTERDALCKRLAPDDFIVALCERGTELDTLGLAAYLGDLATRGVRSVAFVVGGADGLHADIKKKAKKTLALSRLTLPHRLAQVVLLEQLYRAHSVLRGQPYHRA